MGEGNGNSFRIRFRWTEESCSICFHSPQTYFDRQAAPVGLVSKAYFISRHPFVLMAPQEAFGPVEWGSFVRSWQWDGVCVMQ